MSTNLTDITDLSDAALDVLLAVKSGEECITVDHLSPVERQALCSALGTEAGSAWLFGYSEPVTVARKQSAGPDFERMILDRQDAAEHD